MGALRHSVTYQGYPATSFALRWDAGLEPCTGYVDLNLADVEQIIVDVKPVPWGGNTFPGMASIIVTASTKNTIAQGPGKPHQGAGFGNYGDLELKTFDGEGVWHTPITYNRIFIAESGIEEIQRDLAEVRQHKKGKIRVQLSDVRMFYKKYGALLQRFNCRRPGGEWDQFTLKRSGGGGDGASSAGAATDNSVRTASPSTGPGGAGSINPRGDNYAGDKTGNQTLVQGQDSSGGDSYTPWSIKEIMTYLFRQLPGAPAIDPASDLMKDQLEPPVDIIGEGEPIVEWISKLLTQYGYEAHLMPDSQVYLLMKLGKKVEYGKIATGVDQWEEITDCHYERKTIWLKNRPPVVSVIGKRRVRRMSTSYIPVFQSSDDGMFYKLSAVDDVYGYSLSKINKQVMVGHEKNFRDVPPTGTAKGFRRGSSLRKCAYRMYAPITAFPDGRNRVTLQELQRQAYMPMKKCPVYLDELRAWMGMDEDIQDSQEGDKGPFALVSPIVRSYRYGKGFFKDWSKMKEHFDALMAIVDRDVHFEETMKAWVQARMDAVKLDTANESLSRGQLNVQKYLGLIHIAKSFLDSELAKDAELQEIQNQKAAAKQMQEEAAKRFRLATKQELEAAEEAVKKSQQWQQKTRAEFSKYAKAFEKGGAEMARCQLPWGLVPRGNYSINTQTGILMFNDPAVRCVQPFLLDNDTGEVYADGSVTVTYGYELNNNMPMDYTIVSFSPDAKNPDESAEPVCVSMSYPTAMPAYVEQAPNLQLYEDQNGTPFNKSACVAEASNYAHGALKVTQRSEGYTYELDGLRKAILEGGVSTVEHKYEESGVAYTHVYVNAPFTRRTLPGRSRQTWVPSVGTRIKIETSKAEE